MNIWRFTAGWPTIRLRKLVEGSHAPGGIRIVPILVLTIACGFAAPARARAVPPWSQIPKPEQRLLKPWARRWAHLPIWRRRQLLRHANRWMHLTPVERMRALHNLRRWRRLSPQARARIRNAYRRFRSLPRWRQRQLMDRWKRWAGGTGRRSFRHMGRGGGHIPHGLVRGGHFPHTGEATVCVDRCETLERFSE